MQISFCHFNRKHISSNPTEHIAVVFRTSTTIDGFHKFLSETRKQHANGQIRQKEESEIFYE